MSVKKIINKFFLSSRFYNFLIAQNEIKEITHIPADPWPGDPSLAESFFKGDYILAGRKVSCRKNIVWVVEEKDKNWVDELHSFSWLRHLKARSGPLARKHAKFMINNWIIHNKNWCEKSWKLDVLARRISSWTSNMSFLLADKEENFSICLRKSMLKQIAHLNNFASKKYFYGLENTCLHNEKRK